MTSLLNPETKIRVSSVLNKDTQSYGKQHLTDGNQETCWNSDHGSPQFVAVQFENPVLVSELQLEFQGGFVGTRCKTWTSINGSDYSDVGEFFPDDCSGLQVFRVDVTEPVDKLKIVFESSSDFYGRITIYKMDIIGTKA